MRLSTLLILSGLAVGAVTACGTSNNSADGNTMPAPAATIGKAGGSVKTDGASVVIPKGALSGDKQIGLKKLSSSRSKLFTDLLDRKYEAVSDVFVLTPHGTQFDKPVTIELEHEGGEQGLSVQRLDDEDDTTWEEVAATTFESGKATFETTHFSLVVVAHEVVRQSGDAGSRHGGMDAATTLPAKDAGGSSNAQPDAGTPSMDGDFELMLPTPEISIAQGGTAHYNVVAKRAKGFTDPIAVSVAGLPMGVTGSDEVIMGADDGTLIELTVAETATTGTAELSVTGKSGMIEHTAKGSLIVTGQQTGFDFSVAPYALMLAPGGSAQTTLTITPVNGFQGTVNLSLEFAPDGLTIEPTTFQATGSEPTMKTITFKAAQSVAPVMTDVNLNIVSPDSQGGGTIGIGITVQ
jgi:hypothetical protein